MSPKNDRKILLRYSYFIITWVPHTKKKVIYNRIQMHFGLESAFSYIKHKKKKQAILKLLVDTKENIS